MTFPIEKLKRLRYNEKQFSEALHSLSKAIGERNFNEYVRDATIQRFEYTYETAWKVLKSVLSFQGVELRHPREIFSEAFASGWIENPKHWEAMIEDRNLTTHTYKERTAQAVYAAICKEYYPELQRLQHAITKVIQEHVEPLDENRGKP
ncbi:nucleotidyltransferase substrate binding protein [Paenibacillus sp. IB182496]|uniref:Nucleotidyltransferase substrate binding protein n=1 Tax=Paenibacillus sabuli TaxID=2772509 RepID=A0A927GS61_9BACL|nr:HI0074 family nucleotidyltransferase substrate-binding subunit [Paenibacillus sabuli]MBD2846389.1 nucleotidyltransferase substrate binding protein [Paenibacillus sabuli]